jgi:hypothetical protein
MAAAENFSRVIAGLGRHARGHKTFVWETKTMNHFKPINIVDLLGVSPLCSITPEEIWNTMVTPQVKALLGDIISAKISIKETTDGDFPGDEVYNHNGHKIGGTDIKKVRYPYLQCVYKTTYGAFIVKYDGLKFKAIAWFGDMKKPQIIYKAALRDRRHDGTPRTNDTSLIDFPGYDDPVNVVPRFDGDPEDMRFVEASIYAFMPGSRIFEACGDLELDRFVQQPFAFIDKPDNFLRLFWQAWKSNRAPGQNGNPIPDVSKNVVQAFDNLALKAGYDYLENCCSHYHVAKWTEANGYLYSKPAHKVTMEQFAVNIKRVRAELAAKGITLTRPQESWLCVLQSLPEDKIPAEFNFHGPKWIQDNIGPVNLWMYKPVSARAKASEAQRVAKAAAAAEAAKAAPVVVAPAPAPQVEPKVVEGASQIAAAPVVATSEKKDVTVAGNAVVETADAAVVVTAPVVPTVSSAEHTSKSGK